MSIDHDLEVNVNRRATHRDHGPGIVKTLNGTVAAVVFDSGHRELVDTADLRFDDQDPVAYDDQLEATIKFNQKVAAKADELRILDEARARLRAEKVADLDWTDAYLTRGQLLDLPAPEPLIHGVIPRHAYGILRGRDHSFKSFVAIDWALCLATGKPWQGHDVEPVRVLYIAGEGATGLAKRIDAWEYAWGRLVPDDQFTVRATAVNMHQPGPAFDHLLDHVEDGQYGLVIVDTLRRVSGAADGNSSEMGLVVDNLDRIKRATTDGTVLAVAHTDKGDHDTRGYSGIEDDADFVWAAKREDMDLTLELTKMKDGPDGHVIHLAATHQQGTGSLVLTGSDGPRPENNTESQTKILDALRIIPPGAATVTEIRTVAALPKATCYRALKDLVASQQVIPVKSGRTTYYDLPGLLDTTGDRPADNPNDTPDPDPSDQDQELTE